tara:strand:- start:20361 stop:21500 length:1140 start_codon:yes stop_codon:yes gene_type:complete
MKIALDFVATNLASGTKTYLINFCNNLNLIDDKNKIIIYLTKNYYSEIDKSLKNNKSVNFVIKSNFFSISIIRLFWMQLILPIELKLNGVKKLYSPMNITSFLCKFFRIKIILTLHSNLPWKYFQLMPGNKIKKYFKKKIMEISILMSDVLIVNSFYARDEIIELLKLNKNKIHVCYLGLDKKFIDNKAKIKRIEGINYEKDYILSVLSCVKYHNIINLLKAYDKLLKKKISSINLLLVMQILDEDYFLEIKNFIKKNSLEDNVIILSNLNKDYLIELYREAKIYIFSSYCEVFGLTTIEAMSQGCPVLVSNTSALPEINNSVADYFNPDNIDEIESKISEIILDKEKIKIMSTKGFKRSKQFSWKKNVQDTFQIIQRI